MGAIAVSVVFMATAVLLMAGGIGMLFSIGAVNASAEDHYWAKFWEDTPCTEGAVDDDVVEMEWRNSRDHRLRKAA